MYKYAQISERSWLPHCVYPIFLNLVLNGRIMLIIIECENISVLIECSVSSVYG